MKFFSTNGKSISSYIKEKNVFIKNASIKETAQIPYLYSDSKTDFDIEHSLGYFEKRFQKVCEYVIDKHRIPKDASAKIDLLQFIIVQLLRTKFVADDTNKMFRKVAKRLIINSDSEHLKMDKKEMLELTDQAELAVPNFIPLKIADQSLPFLFDLCPALFIIDGKLEQEFVTSDTPIIQYNYLARYTKYERNASQVSHRGIILIVPLSPKVCLAYYDPTCYSFKSVFNIKTGNYIKILNRLIIKNSYKQLFFAQDILESQKISLIRYDRKVRTLGLTVFEGDYYYGDFISDLVHIPGLKLTEFGKKFPDLSPRIDWPHRMENKSINEFIYNGMKLD